MATKTAGRTASAPAVRGCPDWCDGEHNPDGFGNFIHRGQTVLLGPPDSSAKPTIDEKSETPLLTAHVMLPAGPDFDEEPAAIVVDNADLWGPYAELDSLEQVDALLADLKTFTAAVQQMRGQMAAIEEQKS
ncbi:hypothetical protein R6V09_12355 [Streptomyces sp. W16]|uniref:DUF6907 domain-containing protein n=1 Tax=Streptomyces sp. W16 TaxID=3076631 RepID=UPI00295B3640|nr:hypothetical protein [Streptomyces sp. W16]MDV9170923.1 hypothetical protein [Streptomyces sp. W16]